MDTEEVVYKATTTSTKLEQRSKPKTSPFLYLATLVANLTSFACGVAFGWTSPVLPKLETLQEDNVLGRVIVASEASWIAGLLCLGAIFGPLIAGSMADKLGRKKTLLVGAVPMIVSFLMLAYAETVALFYVARLLVGTGIGCIFSVLPMYVAEISEDHNRGTLGCLMMVFLSSGLLFAFAIGPILSIRNFCLASSLPLLLFVILFSVLIPESPHFLASKDNMEDLASSLSKLRSVTNGTIENEMERLTKMEESPRKISFGDLFKSKGLRRGAILSLGMIMLQQFAGINAVIAYMESIFGAAEGEFSPHLCTIIVAIIQVFTAAVTSLLADRLGRRILLLISSFGCCISLIFLGAYFYLKMNKYDVGSLFWLPVASLVAYFVLFNIGLGPLPWTLMAELFPSQAKSIASTITSVTCFAASFLITLFFPPLTVIFGMAQSFWIFAGVCFAGSIFVYLLLPETKGKSLQEIQKLLERT